MVLFPLFARARLPYDPSTLTKQRAGLIQRLAILEPGPRARVFNATAGKRNLIDFNRIFERLTKLSLRPTDRGSARRSA